MPRPFNLITYHISTERTARQYIALALLYSHQYCTPIARGGGPYVAETRFLSLRDSRLCYSLGLPITGVYIK